MKVFVTGGTGFVGSELVKQLTAADHQVVALVRRGSEQELQTGANVKEHIGDVTDPKSLTDGIKGCEAIIHLVGIIRAFPDQGITFERLHIEATQNVLKAAAAAGVKRFLHMSANGARADSETDYQRTKWLAEKAVRNSSCDWTVFRPSLIFGPGGEFLETLAGLVRQLPIVPVVGDGNYRMQPVAVDQVAESYVKALEMPETINKAYCLSGGESYPYDTVLDLVGKALGNESVHKAHQPVALVKPIVSMLEAFDKFPITADQLTMMLEGNECDPQPWANTFNIKPTCFADGVSDCFNVGE